MDKEIILGSYEGKKIQRVNINDKYQVLILLDDGSEIEVLSEGPEGSKLKVNCYAKVKATFE